MNKPETTKQSLSTEESKLYEITKYYLQEHFWNLKKIDISSRIVSVDIYMQLVENGWRPEYKLFIEPNTWLTNIKIKNPASFLAFCNIHWFFPIIDKLYIKNGNKTIDIASYSEFLFVVRLFHLFFFKWYDFVLYDTIKSYLQKPEIISFFENNKLLLPTESEFLALLKLLEDIKKSSFDIPKHHLDDKLLKFRNSWTYRENIFLEISMKYENLIRNKLWFVNTYVKPASYKEDMNQKTDFSFVYLLDKKKINHNTLPIQFTTANDEDKIKKVEDYFVNSWEKWFLYIQADGDFSKKVRNIETDYKYWIEQVERRENQDPSIFPFFINKLKPRKIKDLIILYFYMHQIIKKTYNHWKISFKVENIDLKNVDVNVSIDDFTRKVQKEKWQKKKFKKYTYKFLYNWEYIGTIILWEKL